MDTKSKGAQTKEHHVSRTGTRGTAAKGGAGGKGTWGRADDPSAQLQAATDPAYLDKNDPNYVEDESGGDELLTADDA
ncbi:uncharacterized protein AMSG_09297 [Thecamonas trahens ATCC 50062]|uniref:Hyaluronan/mRNA-binding protein domain-containing protein n=1 Tax=Thecamonas trahens ATCC 50062 TaxID=461836 RepID=A0A0L0DMG2_THETB|nr:hypothetical protein AMSG_09297 [Thecamonas trahens ATCC 50062]KNC53211.1 hypothetical protein AMSG_09297 [Thecamonas trahens ATCC 50062]|eukprot:XP_013754680.1 hypothetical protein AMSG_09297 [Thecamonas trahens ATCC 50062]